MIKNKNILVTVLILTIMTAQALTGCEKAGSGVGNSDDVTSGSALNTNEEVLAPITENSEKMTTLGIEWGTSYEDARDYLINSGYTIDDSEGPNLLYAYINMLDRTWIGKLEFNAKDEMYGYSLALNELIDNFDEFDGLAHEIVDGFYEQYDYPAIKEEGVTSEEFADSVVEETGNMMIYTAPFNSHDVTSIIVSAKVDKSATDTYELYNQMGIPTPQIGATEDDKDYYAFYLAYLSNNYSVEQETELEEIDPSQFSEVISDGEDFQPLSFYRNSENYAIVFNPLEYEEFDENVNLSEYYAKVSWDTGLIDADCVDSEDTYTEDTDDEEDTDYKEDFEHIGDGDATEINADDYIYLISLDELIKKLESGEHTWDEVYSI